MRLLEAREVKRCNSFPKLLKVRFTGEKLLIVEMTSKIGSIICDSYYRLKFPFPSLSSSAPSSRGCRAKLSTPISIFSAGRASETAGMGSDLARSASDPAGGPLSKLEEPLSKLGESWIQLIEPHNQLGGPQIQPVGPSVS